MRTASTLGYLQSDLYKIAGAKFPYNAPGSPFDGFTGTYWIDPVSHLPIKSVGHVDMNSLVGSGGNGWLYETSYQFREPDRNTLPVK